MDKQVKMFEYLKALYNLFFVKHPSTDALVDCSPNETPFDEMIGEEYFSDGDESLDRNAANKHLPKSDLEDIDFWRIFEMEYPSTDALVDTPTGLDGENDTSASKVFTENTFAEGIDEKCIRLPKFVSQALDNVYKKIESEGYSEENLNALDSIFQYMFTLSSDESDQDDDDDDDTKYGW